MFYIFPLFVGFFPRSYCIGCCRFGWLIVVGWFVIIAFVVLLHKPQLVVEIAFVLVAVPDIFLLSVV